jgi:hypothetical protein
MDLQEFCELAVEESDPKNIDHYVYFGDLPLGDTWANTFSHHRDSDILDESNWEVITNDLIHRFPEDTKIEGASHWAVGWVEHLSVRLLEKDGRPTEAAAAVKEWKDLLDNYPIASDEDYSRREWENAIETLEWCGPTPDDPPDEWAEILADELLSQGWHYESDSGGTYWNSPDRNANTDDAIEEVMRKLGWMDEEEA